MNIVCGMSNGQAKSLDMSDGTYIYIYLGQAWDIVIIDHLRRWNFGRKGGTKNQDIWKELENFKPPTMQRPLVPAISGEPVTDENQSADHSLIHATDKTSALYTPNTTDDSKYPDDNLYIPPEDKIQYLDVATGEQKGERETGNQKINDNDMDSDEKKPPGLSYIALISMAIQSAADKKMLLSDIYGWIAERYPFYQMKDKSWRNSIRHNLSLNECFVKNGRSENGKGNYWSIHPANIEDFSRGDYRRRRARRRVRKCDEDLQRLCSTEPSSPPLAASLTQITSLKEAFDGYVPMASTLVPSNFLSALGVEQTRPCAEWSSSTHAYYPGFPSNPYEDTAKPGHKVGYSYEPYYDPQNFSSFWNSSQKSSFGQFPYFGPPSWENTHGTSTTTHTNESTFNVNVNVNVCGNPGTPQQHTSHTFPTSCHSPRQQASTCL